MNVQFFKAVANCDTTVENRCDVSVHGGTSKLLLRDNTGFCTAIAYNGKSFFVMEKDLIL